MRESNHRMARGSQHGIYLAGRKISGGGCQRRLELISGVFQSIRESGWLHGDIQTDSGPSGRGEGTHQNSLPARMTDPYSNHSLNVSDVLTVGADPSRAELTIWSLIVEPTLTTLTSSPSRHILEPNRQDPLDCQVMQLKETPGARMKPRESIINKKEFQS